jgi:hypothetical protein
MSSEQKSSSPRPKTHSSLADQEMDKVEAQFKEFDDQVKEMTLDRMNQSPKHEFQQQTEIASIDRAKLKEIFLKPSNSIGCREKFNEKFRKSYEFDKELVHFEAENHEIIGESIELWTRPYPGMPAEFWKIPVNTAVWAPRYVAERIKGCSYHRLVMKQNVGVGSDGQGNQYYGAMAADSTIQRLDARPISSKKSIFMGGNNF